MANNNKNIISIEDSDGKLHLYICAAFHGKRWAAQMIFPEDKMKEKDFMYQGNCMIKATLKPLLADKVIL